jgi:hypothetical protein
MQKTRKREKRRGVKSQCVEDRIDDSKKLKVTAKYGE